MESSPVHPARWRRVKVWRWLIPLPGPLAAFLLLPLAALAAAVGAVVLVPPSPPAGSSQAQGSVLTFADQVTVTTPGGTTGTDTLLCGFSGSAAAGLANASGSAPPPLTFTPVPPTAGLVATFSVTVPAGFMGPANFQESVRPATPGTLSFVCSQTGGPDALDTAAAGDSALTITATTTSTSTSSAPTTSTATSSTAASSTAASTSTAISSTTTGSTTATSTTNTSSSGSATSSSTSSSSATSSSTASAAVSLASSSSSAAASVVFIPAGGLVATVPCPAGATTVAVGGVAVPCPATLTILSGVVTPTGGNTVLIEPGAQVRLPNGAVITTTAPIGAVLGAAVAPPPAQSPAQVPAQIPQAASPAAPSAGPTPLIPTQLPHTGGGGMALPDLPGGVAAGLAFLGALARRITRRK